MPIRIKKKAAKGTPEPAPVKTPPQSGEKHLDKLCRYAMGEAPNSTVAWWIMASYLYYIHDKSLISDGLYDEIAHKLKEGWDSYEHPHKHLIQPEDLDAGSLYRLKAKNYPASAKGGACHLAKKEWGVTIPRD